MMCKLNNQFHSRFTRTDVGVGNKKVNNSRHTGEYGKCHRTPTTIAYVYYCTFRCDVGFFNIHIGKASNTDDRCYECFVAQVPALIIHARMYTHYH